jgi:hypothetical protein
MSTPHETIDPPRIFFYHLPKTGGITLQRILSNRYGSHYRHLPVYPGLMIPFFHGPQELMQYFDTHMLPGAEQLQALAGHVLYGIHERLPGPCSLVTFLRNPVDRVLSYYFYVLQKERFTPGMLASLAAAQHESAPHNFMINNMQTRYLSAVDGIPQPVPLGHHDTEMLELAKQRLREEFAVVGLTERFDESLLLMQNRFNWPNPYYYPLNTTRKYREHPEITDAVLESIRESNQMDLALYAYAQELFDARIQAEGEPFAGKLRRFRRKNKLQGAIMCARDTAKDTRRQIQHRLTTLLTPQPPAK